MKKIKLDKIIERAEKLVSDLEDINHRGPLLDCQEAFERESMIAELLGKRLRAWALVHFKDQELANALEKVVNWIDAEGTEDDGSFNSGDSEKKWIEFYTDFNDGEQIWLEPKTITYYPSKYV